MSATTTTLPSPQSPWPPGVHPASSTAPIGVSPRAASTVGQFANSILAPETRSPRPSRESCSSPNNYFGLVVDTSSNLPNSNPGPYARKNWDLTTASQPGARIFETWDSQVENVGSILGHRVSSSFDRQTQSQRDLGRKLEEDRERQSPTLHLTRHSSWIAQLHQNNSNPMDIDSHGAIEKGSTQDPSPAARAYDQPLPRSSLASLSYPIVPRAPRGQSQSLASLSLPLHSPRSFAGTPQLHRSETLPASVDQGSVTLITADHCAKLLESSPDATLIFDVRPYLQFSKSRIKGSLNLCIPTTLLKRPSFNVQKLEDTFSNEPQKKRFKQWSQCEHIIAYDSTTSNIRDATTLIHVLKKFTNAGWGGETLVLCGGIGAFKVEYPQWIESQKDELSTSPKGPGSTNLTLPASRSVAGGCSIPKSGVVPHPFFSNIRQNMDLIGGVGQMPVRIPSRLNRDSLPQWLSRASDPQDNGKSVSEEFLAIEKSELSRMQEAFVDNVSYGPHTSKTPGRAIRIAGIEKGSKNRYNNIYPFDHSRVRLQQVAEDGCDYINASYTQASRSNKRYIATQAPIPATFNDFWRVVWEQDVRVIVMLTAESEGPQVKCHNYWNSDDYGPFKLKVLAERQIPLGPMSSRNQPSQARRVSGQRRSTNPHTAVEKSRPHEGQDGSEEIAYATLRHFSLVHSEYPFQPLREITQLQYSHWPDFGVPAEPAHLVKLVEECSKLSAAANHCEPSTTAPEAQGQKQVLVHCSAGCGRTGTFCTVDSVIDMLKRQMTGKVDPSCAGGDWMKRNDIDLIARTVEEFRLQRPSMVQSLLQFVLCYETILDWLSSHPAEGGGENGSHIPLGMPGGKCGHVRVDLGRDTRRSYHG
ncbi:hypothetical protein AJ80_06203 [Polytolypa hystricis UAMH7299]|uniref:protein-tyrosine-phosphatase n=1 Tax=Polytolypa hystricis (strain UAMH7299) TaxID=1447883 RepID=A0A2B7XYP5_POLH7|nr:hypothetical protein AJ80_06203 [Polytolypa hystricis UAMH7299]